MKIPQTLRTTSKFGRFAFLAILLLPQLSFAQEGNLLPETKPEKAEVAPVVTFKGSPAVPPGQFSGSEVFYQPNLAWGFKLNLAGFVNLSKSVAGRTIVGFGVREDSVGLTLAHLYINSFAKADTITTAKFYAGRLFKSLKDDTSLAISDLSRSSMLGFETISYDRIEVWPQPDPNNPGQMFDSTLVRRHFNAITAYRDSWIDIHLSKTEYQLTTPAVFTDILKTFEITENFERKKVQPVKPKIIKKP